MVRIIKRHSRADDPEIAADAKAAKAIGYRHHSRRRKGVVESVIVAPGAKDMDDAKTKVGASRYLKFG